MDPWDVSNTEQQGGGFLGQSPDFWRNLASFGANMSVAANARTPQGFLQYGPGIAGPLGAGTLGAMEQARQNAQLQGQLGYTRAEIPGIQARTQSQQLQNAMMAMGLPLQAEIQRQTLQQIQQNGVYGDMGGSPMGGQPQQQGAPRSLIDSIHQAESGGNPAAINQYGYTGASQYGKAALQDVGFYHPAHGENMGDNQNWQGAITVPGMAPMSREQFAANPQAQAVVDQAHFGRLYQMASDPKYQGAASQIGRDNLVAAMHFAGQGNVDRWLAGDNSFRDGNGVSIPDYIRRVQSIQQGGGQGGGIGAGIGPDQQLLGRANQLLGMSRSLAMTNPAMSKVYNDQGMDLLNKAYAGPVSAAQAAGSYAGNPKEHFLTTREGVVSLDTGKYIARSPQMVTMHDEHGRPYIASYTPREGEEGGVSNIVPAGPSENAIKQMEERSHQFENEDLQHFQTATEGMSKLDQLDAALKQMNQSAWTATGTGAAQRIVALKGLNTVLGMFGTQVLPEEMGAAGLAQKLQKTLGFEISKSLGSREAAQIVGQAISTVPGAGNTPQEIQAITASLREGLRYVIDKRNFQEQWRQTHEMDLTGSDEAFLKERPVASYVDRAKSQYMPISIPGNATPEAVAKKFFPGTQIRLPDGRVKVVPGPVEYQTTGMPQQQQ